MRASFHVKKDDPVAMAGPSHQAAEERSRHQGQPTASRFTCTSLEGLYRKPGRAARCYVVASPSCRALDRFPPSDLDLPFLAWWKIARRPVGRVTERPCSKKLRMAVLARLSVGAFWKSSMACRTDCNTSRALVIHCRAGPAVPDTLTCSLLVCRHLKDPKAFASQTTVPPLCCLRRGLRLKDGPGSARAATVSVGLR